MSHRCHDHSHSHEGKENRLFASIWFNVLITAAEVVGGLISGSLALLSDALHNFSDVVALILSWIAVRLSKQKSTLRSTFGLKRAQILAALINAAILLAVAIPLFQEAIKRFTHPSPINSGLMLIVAIIGLVANIASALLLQRDAKGDLNVRSSFLHLVSDAVSSVAVILGGLCIYWFNSTWVDPVLTIVIAAYILYGGLALVKDSVNILMQNVPDGLDIEAIKRELEKLEQVQDIHHVHVWAVTESEIHFEAHVNLKKDLPVSQCSLLNNEISEILKEKFSIAHAVLQLEYQGCPGTGLVNQE